MSKRILNYLVDLAALAALLLLAATGALLALVLPPGSGRFLTLWGMDRHEWGDVHFGIAASFIALMLVHLVLHWSWIVAVAFGRGEDRSAARAGLTAVILIVAMGAAAAPFFAQVQSTGGDAPHRGRSKGALIENPSHDALRAPEPRRGQSHAVQGFMTLAEVEARTGVKVETILKELNLPPDTPKTERLGRLKNRHGFEMGDVDRILEKHSAKTDARP